MYMTRIAKVSTLAAATLALAILPAWGATTGTLSLSGFVPAVLEISVSPAAEAANLPIRDDVSGLPVASVLERSNKKAGYRVLLESASALARQGAGPVLRSAETNDVLAYSLTYDGVAVDLSSGSALITDAVARTGGAGVTKELAISFSGTSVFLDESTYGDTLTFTIVAK